jgi:hypothetical protein
MERNPTDPPRARADRARHWLALVADAAFLIACLFLLYTALGGEVRWRTALFRITLTETNRPTQLCVLLLLIKAVFGLDRGLFASLATTHVPIVQPLAAVLHALDLRLRAVFLAYRLPLLVSATSLFVSLGLLELYLRHFPHTLPHALANHLTTPYHTGPSGIYRWAPELRTTLMHPNHERTIYFNGYRWRHKTDSRGFRNPVETLTASVVLLGDSIVYGHGVEEVSTIRHHLEAILGQPVANLGIQGSSIHNEYQVLKTFGLGLRPRYVFLFFLANDIDDLGRLGEAALAAFLDTAVSDHATPFFDARPPKQPWWGARAYRAIETRWDDLSVVKAFDFLRGTVRARWGAPAEASEADWEVLPPLPAGARSVLAMRFHLHALRKIQNLADRHGFVFVNVFTYSGHMPHESAYEKILEAFCGTHGIAFLSLRPAFEQAVRNGEDVFLKADGHLSDGGARLAAQVLARYIDLHPATPGGWPAR